MVRKSALFNIWQKYCISVKNNFELGTFFLISSCNCIVHSEKNECAHHEQSVLISSVGGNQRVYADFHDYIVTATLALYGKSNSKQMVGKLSSILCLDLEASGL